MFVSARIPFHKLCKNVAHDHEFVRDWPIEICVEMLLHNQNIRMDLMNHENVNALSNDFPVQSFHRIHRKHMVVLQHEIYCVLLDDVSMETSDHIPGI